VSKWTVRPDRTGKPDRTGPNVFRSGPRSEVLDQFGLRSGRSDGIFCKRCTCKSCGKDTHIGYNCPSKVPVISNPEPCNNQTIDELPQTLPIFHPTFHSEAESPFTLDSTATYVDESPNIFNPPPQSPVYPCEFCGNDAYYGHYCTPQAPFIYPEPCYNQDFNFPQDFQTVPQQYPCCDDCGQYTVDHPIFKAHNDYVDSQIQLNSTLAKIKDQMTSITSLCELACQVAQKKLEEKQIEEERAAKAKNWKLSICYYDDDDEERSDSLDDNIISGLPPFSAITPDEPVLSTEEPDNSLSMGDEHLDTILATKSDEFIKSSVENLIPIPSKSQGIPEHVCDVPSHDNSPPLDVSKDQIKDFSESNKEFSSIDDDSFSIDDIDYISSGSPTTHSDSSLYASFIFDLSINSFPPVDRSDSYEFTDDLIPFIYAPEYDCFRFTIEPNSRDFTKDVVEDIYPTKEPQVLNILPTHPTLQLNMKFQPSRESLFAYVVWIFLPFLVYSVVPCYLRSLRTEDIIFYPGICKSIFYRPDISHRCGTVTKFNTHRSHLNTCPILFHGQNTPLLDVFLFHFYPP
nr:hypothetical protein [Tanacetum cinerariifolium]